MNRIILHVGIGALSVLLILITIFGLVAEANAVADDATPTPEVVYPLVPLSNTGAHWKVQISGSVGTHIRRIAGEADAAVAGLRVFRKGTCRSHLNATCVKVVAKHYGKTPWYAQTTFPKYNLRVIQVNLDVPNAHPYAVIAHEFGHVLGLGHHAMSGVCGGMPDEVHFSPEEIKALRGVYPKGGWPSD